MSCDVQKTSGGQIIVKTFFFSHSTWLPISPTDKCQVSLSSSSKYQGSRFAILLQDIFSVLCVTRVVTLLLLINIIFTVCEIFLPGLLLLLSPNMCLNMYSFTSAFKDPKKI